MCSRRAVFLDRDGVLNEDRAYVHRAEGFVFLPHVLDACRIFHQAGFLLIVVTNQSGIGRGFFSEEQFLQLSQWMCEAMQAADAPVEKIYFCPHHPQAAVDRYRCVCRCRKPQPGMITQAAEEFGIDLPGSILFGDSVRDTDAALAAGVGERVLLGKNAASVPVLPPSATRVFRSLYEAACSDWFRESYGAKQHE